MNYVKEVVSTHIKCLKEEEDQLKHSILHLEKQLKSKHESLRGLKDKRSELEEFMNRPPGQKV